MDTSRFSSNGFASNGNGTGHADAAALRVCQGLEESRGTPGSSAGVEGKEGKGGSEGTPSPRRLEDSPAGLGGGGKRDEAGRFLKGCKGGPGNPYNRRVALYKRLLLEAVTEEDIVEIGKTLAGRAREGDVAAARVLFTYILPKGVAPDRVDVDEWQGYKAEQGMMEEITPILKSMDPSLPLDIVREMRPELTAGKARVMSHVFRTGSMDLFGSMEDLRVVASGGTLKQGKKGKGKAGKRRRGA